jgi:hypothetical protein
MVFAILAEMERITQRARLKITAGKLNQRHSPAEGI